MFKKKFTICYLAVVCSMLLIGCAKGSEEVAEVNDCNSLVPRFNRDKNNLEGDFVMVMIGRQDVEKVKRVYMLIDEKPYEDDFVLRVESSSLIKIMNTYFFKNGPHNIKIESMGFDDKVICSRVCRVAFNNEVSDVNTTKRYRLDGPFYFSASLPSPSSTYTLEVMDFNDTIVYAKDFSGSIKAVIPSETFRDKHQMYELRVKDSSGDVKFKKFIGRDTDEEIIDCNSIAPRFNIDKNSLSGDTKVSIGQQDWNKVEKVCIFVDNKKLDGYNFYLYTGPNVLPTTMVRTQFFKNGPHNIKIESMGFDDKVICSHVCKVIFNNEISDVNMTRSYRIDKPFYFSALSSSPSAEYTVEITDLDNKIVYSGNFTGDIQAVVPGDKFEDSYSQAYDLIVKDSLGNIKFEKSLIGMDFDDFEEEIEEQKSEPEPNEVNIKKL
ncbi:MAG: hypothetical protein PHH54_06315 [Candidatus Nanoarchaeia archaeon]|nr:hypothetical protein [Candidatus Nanoarchaeia archaeon]